MTKATYAVITADVIGSRKVEAFRRKRDAKLRAVSDAHRKGRVILSDYAVTAWDEFQGILRKPEYLPRAILDLRRTFYPMQLWIALGIGEVSEARRAPVNRFAGGESFERAREAAELLKKGNSRFRVLTRFKTGNDLFDSIANTTYSLQDTLLQDVTAKQWHAINLHMQTGKQEAVARKLGLTVSTVSRNLKRAHYWQFLEVCETMERLLKEWF
jgi:SatD family (SatD)